MSAAEILAHAARLGALGVVMTAAAARAETLAPGEVMIRGSAPITFRVAVKVSNLMPEVAQIRVRCSLQHGTVPIVHGETTTQVSTAGNFEGVVTVPVNILYPNQNETRVAQVNNYNCALQLVSNGNPPQVWAPDKSNAPVWAQPKGGSVFANSISGKFPPKQ
jgi:hypothetical protein